MMMMVLDQKAETLSVESIYSIFLVLISFLFQCVFSFTFLQRKPRKSCTKVQRLLLSRNLFIWKNINSFYCKSSKVVEKSALTLESCLPRVREVIVDERQKNRAFANWKTGIWSISKWSMEWMKTKNCFWKVKWKKSQIHGKKKRFDWEAQKKKRLEVRWKGKKCLPPKFQTEFTFDCNPPFYLCSPRRVIQQTSEKKQSHEVRMLKIQWWSLKCEKRTSHMQFLKQRKIYGKRLEERLSEKRNKSARRINNCLPSEERKYERERETNWNVVMTV